MFPLRRFFNVWLVFCCVLVLGLSLAVLTPHNVRAATKHGDTVEQEQAAPVSAVEAPVAVDGAAEPETPAETSAEASAEATPAPNPTQLPRYWVEERINSDGGKVPHMVEGKDVLGFVFSPHQQLCQSKYRNEWFNLCARSTGLTGNSGKGVSISPAVEGEWEWTSDMALTFTPYDNWPADQSFTVTIAPRGLPAGTEIMSPLIVQSRPIVAVGEGNFKFDRQDLSVMAVSGRISFNYPMEAESVMRRISVSAPGEATPGDELLYGQPVFSWDTDNHKTLYFSLPVTSLPQSGSTLRVALNAGARAKSGGTPNKGLDFFVNLPGKDGLFTMDQANAVVVTTPDLRAKQLLTLDFSLPTTPREVQPVLQVLLMPRERVQTVTKQSTPYRWWSTEELTPEIMELATSVGLVLDDGADKASRMVSFGFDQELEPGRSLLVTIPSGVKGLDGLTLNKQSTFFVQVPSFNEELRIMQNGAVLALTGDKTLSLYGRNMDEIQYEVAQVRPEFINHFVASNGGGFGQSDYYSNLPLERLAIFERGVIPLARKDAQTAQFASLDLTPLLKNGQKGLFQVQVQGMRATVNQAGDQRFVLVTDLGLIHKKTVEGSIVYAASLASGKPQKGVRVQVLGANGLPVFEGRTDRDGRVNVPKMTGMSPEKQPVAVVAMQGADLAFLPFENYERTLDYSRFDVGGAYSVEGLNAYIFGQRDLYRPGESVHFGYIVKQGKWELEDLTGLPLRAVVRDPRGNVFSTQQIALPQAGFGELNYELPETATTGVYSLDLMLASDSNDGVLLQSGSFRVEEFQPDTLRMSVKFDPSTSVGWLRPKDMPEGLHIRINLMNLFGAPAIGNRVTTAITAQTGSFRFSREYPDWTFYDAAAAIQTNTEELPTAETDAEGNVVGDVSPDLYANQTMRLTVRAEGFDAGGGRSVKASASLLVSPLDAVVGWKTGSNLGFLRENKEAVLDLLAIGPDLKPVDMGTLKFEIVAVTYVKSLIRDDRGQYRYENTPQYKTVEVMDKALPAKGANFKLYVSEPGSFILTARDANDLVVARISYWVAGNAPAAYGEDREPMFGVRIDKANYNPGESVQVSLSTPYKGAGLITIERDTVVSQVWFRSDAGDIVESIRLPEGFEGRAFLNVTYFRALDDKDIFTKPMASMVVPFNVNMDGRDLKVSLRPLPDRPDSDQQADLVVRPGGTFPVEVTAKRPARAVVFAVDEGILQMTSYRTPDPLTALLADRALQVSTMQYFDLLMPEYSLMQQALSAFGGGEGANFAAAGQNPFRRPGEKLAVFWSGIVDIGPDATIVDIPVPASYSGQLRVMAVACAPEGVSATRADVMVQAEVVIQPSMPLFVAPGDEFEAAITLTDMSGLAPASGAKSGRHIRLNVQTDAGLELISEQPISLELFDAFQKTIMLRFKALDAPGGSTVNLVAEPANGQPGNPVSRPVGLSVRPSMPRTTEVTIGRVRETIASAAIQDSVVPFERKLYPQFASLTAGVSSLPLPVAHGLMRYLDRYPYGCTEQLVSAAFPALVMLSHPELAPHGESFTPEALKTRVVNTMDMLSSRHLGSEKFSAWPGGYSSGLFLSAYVADFLISAKELGIFVPYTLERDVFRSLTNTASTSPSDMDDARTKAYACWVLTRSGVLTTNHLATLTAWLDRYEPEWSKDITAVFMAGCWKLMMQPDEAERLISGYTPEGAHTWGMNGGFDGFTNRSFYLSILAAHFPDRLRGEQAQVVLDEILDLAQSRLYVTISAAQASRALMLYSQGLTAVVENSAINAKDAQGNPVALELAPVGKAQVREASLVSDPDNPLALSGLASIIFQTSGPAYWQVESTGFERTTPASSLSQGMEISRDMRTPEGESVRSVKVGDELVMVIRARSFEQDVSDIAITDLLPGGFEMVLAEGGEAVESGTSLGMKREERHMSVIHVERREDRLQLFPNLTTYDSVYLYRVRAAVRGSFILPPVYGEAMYNPTIRARSQAGMIVVE